MKECGTACCQTWRDLLAEVERDHLSGIKWAEAEMDRLRERAGKALASLDRIWVFSLCGDEYPEQKVLFENALRLLRQDAHECDDVCYTHGPRAADRDFSEHK